MRLALCSQKYILIPLFKILYLQSVNIFVRILQLDKIMLGVSDDIMLLLVGVSVLFQFHRATNLCYMFDHSKLEVIVYQKPSPALPNLNAYSIVWYKNCKNNFI